MEISHLVFVHTKNVSCVPANTAASFVFRQLTISSELPVQLRVLENCLVMFTACSEMDQKQVAQPL